MTTNSRTWFYNEPEHRPYYIEERVNQNLWAMRFGSIYLDCVRAEPPFLMEGVWNGMTIGLEWQPNVWLKVSADKENQTLIAGFAQMLQFLPTFGYTNTEGVYVVEWWREEGEKRYEAIKGNPTFTNVKRYKAR
ncbi:MAG TPA: hypothetical protein PLD47_14815 [Aggregatilineales bacterium]|nr:hypothetical protein [Anaerolineales bacterium]HRE48997.1 hypothetical protein [Aggregatilineales bacterium]